MLLTDMVYRVTREFPPEERFGLTNQLRRAAVSVPSNIAEGNGRGTKGELTQFVGIARGSALEIQTQLEIAQRQSFGNGKDLMACQELAAEVVRILNASMHTLRRTPK